MIRVLLPLNMYNVTYELAHGRPYSKLEELLLRAVNDAQGPAGRTFRDLRGVFKVHDRLLTEGLVTLIQEGWVAMVQHEQEMHYLVTEEGRLTISSGRRPSNLRVRTSRANIVRERLTGQLARSSDLSLITSQALRRATNRLAWSEALRPRMIRSAINGGETERLLPRSDQRQEWIRWIDSVARVNTDLYYLPVRVDLDKSEVIGLPHRWQHLTKMILEEVAERHDDLANDADFQRELSELMRNSAARNGRREAGDTPAPGRTKPYAEAPVSCQDIALTTAESLRLVDDVLARSSGNVLIVAGRLDREGAIAARDLLVGLRDRGVNVDLLWSCEEIESLTKEVLDVLGAARGGPPKVGKVTFNRTPAHAAADLVLASTETGPVAVVGSGLLSSPADGDSLSPAARFSDPGVLGALARLCAGWWEEIPGDEGTLPAHRWKHLAERWVGEAAVARSAAPVPAFAESASCGADECTGLVALLIGPQQATVRRELAAESGPRYLVADAGSSADALATQTSEDLPEGVGRLYRAVGGREGWRFLRRPGDTWKGADALRLPPPSPLHRVAAVGEQWLIEYADARNPALSFCITGHVAVRAWERTSGWTRGT
ncbi:hypothetical protein QFZ67_002211 [Streptomyces sp. V1I1]|nr:hypothetical protein [Streptomyces sp. V1I1]